MGYTSVMKIAITGGAGFIGTQLTQILLDQGHEVIILDLSESRIRHTKLTSLKVDLTQESVPHVVAQCHAIIHLAGANIFGKWTPAYKKMILSSRVDSARALINFLSNHTHSVTTFISASAIGYYGDTGDQITTEDTSHSDTQNPKDFLASVCKKWEAVLDEVPSGIRTVSVRTGIVLGKNGGMLQKLIPIFSYGLGGNLGNGEQWFSWISINDLVRVYIEVLRNPTLSGPINAVAPEPVQNKTFTKTLGRILHRPTLMHVPKFMVYAIVGELAGAILQSSHIQPKKLVDAGFTFTEPTLELALSNTLCKNTTR